MDELLESVALALGNPVPTEVKKLWNYIFQLDTLRFQVLMAIATATQTLAERRLQCLEPKSSLVTELDRTTIQQAGAASQEAQLSRLVGSSSALEAKLSLLTRYLDTLENSSNKEISHVRPIHLQESPKQGAPA